MMYNSKFVACIKSNGKVLREFKDTCYVPFGAEYSLLLKNLNSVRALVSVTIDGVDVADGGKFVVNANDEFEIKRFIKNGNLSSGNKFKFIERTAGVENHRGIKLDDGIIRIEFQFEKPQPKYVSIKEDDLSDIKWKMRDLERKIDSKPTWVYPTWPYYPTTTLLNTTAVGSTTGMIGSTTNCTANMTVTANALSVNASSQLSAQSAEPTLSMYSATMDSTPSKGVLRSARAAVPVNEAGITVAGSRSDQKFTEVDDFEVESEVHVMVIKLLGETNTGKVVKQAVSVKVKPKCVTCGRVNKATNKFCSDCGTALQII